MDSEVRAIRAAIDGFIGDRLQAKLDNLSAEDARADEKRKGYVEAYTRDTWVAGAVTRVSQIQLVTHALKYIHSDARGTNVYCDRAPVPEPMIGTTAKDKKPDVVGNAAALDVYKFLMLEVDGKTLLERAQADDPAFKAALTDDAARAAEWCGAFAGITGTRGEPATDTLAKQVYFPLGENAYHLLAPLYPTSLMQQLHERVDKDRFSEPAKAAREARRKGAAHIGGYRDYPNLAVRRFGGSKPQNISQLNSERRGLGYLLPSFPPQWRDRGLKPPVNVSTVFDVWLNRWRRVRQLTSEMREYLESVTGRPSSMFIRQRRSRYLSDIIDELLLLATAIQRIPPGWSGATDCRLSDAEALWLDPGRAAMDEEFSERRRMDDWPDTISERFGNWLNKAIRSEVLAVGYDEQQEWKTELGTELAWLKREIDCER